MHRRVLKTVGVLATALFVASAVASNGDIYTAWPPKDIKLGQPRYDISVPSLNSELGPNNEKVVKMTPHPTDNGWVAMYDGANRLYANGRKTISANKMLDSGKRTVDSKDVKTTFSAARRQYGIFTRRVDELERDPGNFPHYRQSQYRWRMIQKAAVSVINTGNMDLLTGPGQTAQGRLTTISNYERMLKKFGAIDLHPDFGQWVPCALPKINEDDRKLLAQMHNNVAVALVREANDRNLRELKAKKVAIGSVHDGWAYVRRPELDRFLKSASGRDCFAKIRKALDHLRVALKYRPDSEFYFKNLYRTLHGLNFYYRSLFNRQSAAACRRLVDKMSEAIETGNVDKRKAVVADILNDHLCFGSPTITNYKSQHDPDHPYYGLYRPGSAKPDAASPGQKRPPLKGTGQKVIPPPRCGPAIAGKTDCVRKRIEGH